MTDVRRDITLNHNQEWFRIDEYDQRINNQKAKREGIEGYPSKTGYHRGADREEGFSSRARLVYEEAKKKKKSLSLSTTYATLNELSRHGIIKTLQFDKMENRYEGNLEEHINLICERCKKILDYKVPICC